MVIEAYSSAFLSGTPVKEYQVRVNPSKYTKTLRICYDQRGSMGEMAAVVKFNRMPPTTMNFELLFDATGVIEGSASDLALEIQRFLDTIYTFQGNIHQPYYLKVLWGSECFGARATNVVIEYTLFSTAGAPLRARAQLSLTHYLDATSIQKQSGKKSPDVTHRFRVNAGDTLPAISSRAYGDPSWYPEVARLNGLVNFRALRPGTEVHCPPLAGREAP